MRRLLARLRVESLDARAISGTRTYQEQDVLYRQGRAGKPGPVVTYARGGQSNHNFGLAIDIGIFDRSGRYLNGDKPGDLPPYEQAGAFSAGVPGLEWGGNWPKKKRDLPHYQLATGLELEEVRRRFETGQLVL
jgi:peptidoglycan L-alanyl-D-glutamate endopeptidase CwlK